MKNFAGLPAAAVAIGLVAGDQASAQGSDPGATHQDGHGLVLLLCAPCHVVSSDQQTRPALNQPAPTFLSIVNRQDFSTDWLRNFLGTTHATTSPPFKMPNPDLADYQTEEITNYMISLKGQH